MRKPDNNTRNGIFALCMLALLLAACGDSPDEPKSELAPATSVGENSKCPLGTVIPSADGKRRLALIVGVGKYINPDIPELPGAAADAKRMYDLLTSADHGYGFPRQNVCLVVNEHAVLSSFRHLMNKALVERARADDVALIYFAGHGSRARDQNGDEPDFWDETLMFNDSRTETAQDLLDDEFNRMLVELHSKTRDITVMLDSCNSATATRGDDRYRARFFAPPAIPDKSASGDQGDGASSWTADNLPGIKVFSAASDGSSALERDGRGIFTDALITTLSQAGDQPLTYAQAARQIRQLVSAESYQIPYFQGTLEQGLFGGFTHQRPVSWEITGLQPALTLAGPPIPGLGLGAELRIYPGNATGSATRDPAKAKATVVINRFRGLSANAHVISSPANSKPLAPGDLAVLIRPADRFLKLNVSLREGNAEGGISSDLAAEIESHLSDQPEALNTLRMVRGRGDFELSLSPRGSYLIRGPENHIRNEAASPAEAITLLWQHARQRALKQLRGQGGDEFTDGDSLQIQLLPASKQPPCAKGQWQQQTANQLQIVPLCHQWNIRVSLDRNAASPLLVGGVILSNDGSNYGFPADGRSIRLQPGESYVFKGRNETFMGTPPLDITEEILVFGSKESNPVPWHLLTTPATGRGKASSGLYRALDRYLTPGARGASLATAQTTEEAWTVSSLPFRVEANTRFTTPAGNTPVTSREYTIKQFDLRPYLPDDSTSALHRLLQQADSLAMASATDGYNYKQHDWSRSSDAENLALGIDCSRAIWYAFTRAGLEYNRDNRYLSTAQMVTPDTAMQDQFQRCDGGPVRLGDILVYRDDSRGDGHVVMVIDPDKRIAWGSHGWDGNPKLLPVEPDTGVEYQLIKFKPDWQRWDRSGMALKACWRYREFAGSTTDRGGLGHRALQQACNTQQCGFRQTP